MDGQTRRDYYEILGVSREASAEELRRAFRTKARSCHPDVCQEPDAEERFKEVSEAYEVLRDSERRSIYDRYGHAGLEQGGFRPGGMGDFGFGGFADIFEDIFGFGTRGAPGASPHRGADLRFDLEISFEDAVFGAEHEIELSRPESCTHCGGSGAEPGTSPVRCPECGGSGQIRRAQQSIFGSFVNVTTCPRCQGRGEVVNTPCSECHGTQRVERTRRLVVDIPAGVEDGMRIRLAGEGEAGTYGGPAGNLYVVLPVKPHQFFHRRYNDIILSLNVNIVQATLGDEVTVPTVDGEERLVIPSGTQAGSSFRMRGHGVPALRGSGRGDQIVIVNVAVPTRVTPEQRELFELLGKTLGHEVQPQGQRGFLERIKEALGI